ncbi:SpoIIE family protein phosphatase [Spirulina sp. CS-785/01]|uniref:SpoIIE family protein phosphatase n=1 Tax=Spirulina sp. CS-785/01 TaxID=3021716 RepID=UPI00233071FF|nr:SpoIIE family protein phosphatase [Spirulina sp. CS-785/01]MDB9311631.1 SpoIIE family protein phosphatase [Spirulina sp. CS-785/01]
MSQASSKKLKLMVVDDEPDNLDLLYRTFRRDFKVFKADGAIAALDLLDTEGEMAVIISDQRMPVMNGTEFLSKTVDRFPETIRILLTGYTDVEDLVDAINSGKVFKYITKPWNPENLKAVVQQASDTYRVLKQRTNELRRALRREEVLNVVTSTIRESLDYQNMLQTIVKTIGENFEATAGILRPVEGEKLINESFYYLQGQPEATEDQPHPAQDGFQGRFNETNAINLMEQVLSTQETQQNSMVLEAEDNADLEELAVALNVQQQPLAILYLNQIEGDNSWTEEDVNLLESVAEQAALAVSQAKLYQRTQQQAEKMRAELEVARQIQRNLLRQSWGDTGPVKVDASCYPAREVGGDFFEVYVHPQGDVWLAVGDVSGKGVPAALFMASAISILRRELSQEASPEPETVLRNLNQTMNEDLFSTNCFITMVIARYTPETKELVYANSGHIYPMVWHHQESVQKAQQNEPVTPNYLKTRGIPVGILPKWKGESGRLTLQQGDVFLLTSDGMTEATVTKRLDDNYPGNGEMLNQDGLWQLILQEENFELNSLLNRFREYTNQVQEDDQTMLFLEVL